MSLKTLFTFPSASIIFTEAYKTFLRFPLVIISSVLGAIVSIALVETDPKIDEHNYLFKPLFCALLGIPLFFSISLYIEKTGVRKPRSLLIYLAGIVVLALYYLSTQGTSVTINVTRFFQLDLCMLLLASFAPFLSHGEMNGFWQYNKTLFLRFLTSGLFSGVLFAGLALALLAIDNLFEVHIDEKFYFQLWLFLAFVFNTPFFLGGVPRNIHELDRVTDYPRGLKIFTQYVLIPLTTIYFVILFAYAAKIIITWDWPEGMIAPLVSGVSILGIFSLLFLYPIENHTENRWIKTYSRWFYLALFPLLILLMLALWKRVSEYGITEKRYFLIALTVWITAISFYFTFSKEKNIKLIPITLFLVAIITSFGPWGAYDVSERSQTNRLDTLLGKNDILVDGKLFKSGKRVSFDDRKEISSIFDYLIDTHGTKIITQRYTGVSLVDKRDDGSTKSSYEITTNLMKDLGLEYLHSWQVDEKQFNFSTDYYNQIYRVSGYDYSFRVSINSTVPAQIKINDNEYEIVYLKETKSVAIKSKTETLISIPLEATISEIKKSGGSNNYTAPAEMLKIEGENERIKARIYFQNISGTKTDEELEVSYITGDVLLSCKGGC